MNYRDYWIEEGVPANLLDELERFAPIEKWDIHWESSLSKEEKRYREPDRCGPGKEPGRFMTRVRCPKCGQTAICHLDAVSDFYCDDDTECGYDYLNDDEGLKPLPADW